MASPILLIASMMHVQGLDNGLGLTPQMGYNTWHDLSCSLTEDLVRDTADAIKTSGLDKLGYCFVSLDDCWAEGRYANGTVYAETPRFSSASLRQLADYVNSLGLQCHIFYKSQPIENMIIHCPRAHDLLLEFSNCLILQLLQKAQDQVGAGGEQEAGDDQSEK